MSSFRNLPLNFQEILSDISKPAAPWKCCRQEERSEPFEGLANWAFTVKNGRSLFPLGAVVPIATNTSVSIEYLGGAYTYDGVFQAFMFSGPGYDVVRWVGRDLIRCRTVWRGDEGSYERASLTLRLSDHGGDDLVA